ncbi:hypothetical protein [Lysinibacillus sp. NPDC093692]|uniref:hypothetical protein n=1 Tax=Lysinibacillus sp. NPDC093692 TaxID=3390578 RepID=UPI003D04C546
MSTQITKGEIMYSVRMETNIFEELASKMLDRFKYELSEYTMFLHDHYHIDRITDNYEIIHAVIAYQVSETVWEFYYQDGILDVAKKTGTVAGETCYLYKLELDSSEDNLEKNLEKSFDDWLKTFI